MEQDLVGEFFKVLSKHLDDKVGRRRKWWQRILRIGRAASDPAIDAAAKLAVLVDPSGGPGAKAVTALKKPLGSVIDRWLEEPSIKAAYEDLFVRLRDRSEKILVIIDDIVQPIREAG